MMPVVTISAGEATNGRGNVFAGLTGSGMSAVLTGGETLAGHVAKADMAPEAAHMGVGVGAGRWKLELVKLSGETFICPFPLIALGGVWSPSFV